MVVEKQKKVNRLKSMYPLRAKVNKTYLKSIEAIQAGKPAVWGMLNFYYGDPILKAMDREVVYPENYGAIAAATGVARQRNWGQLYFGSLTDRRGDARTIELTLLCPNKPEPKGCPFRARLHNLGA